MSFTGFLMLQLPRRRVKFWKHKVKDTKLQILTTRFEELKMSEDESFDSFYGKLNGFLGFSRLSLTIGLWVEAPVVSFTQTVWWLSSQLSPGWNFQSRKTLIQNFQIFSHRFLATWTSDLFVTHYSREKRMFCTLRVIFKAVFKNFSFFPRISWLFIFLDRKSVV